MNDILKRMNESNDIDELLDLAHEAGIDEIDYLMRDCLFDIGVTTILKDLFGPIDELVDDIDILKALKNGYCDYYEDAKEYIINDVKEFLEEMSESDD